MGQVFRLRDSRLKRDVAVKVLPEIFATDPERIARFEREAQLLAALNHPNIAQIHGVEHADATLALIMELVEGETLADRVAMPTDEALPIARQIVDALEAAHEAVSSIATARTGEPVVAVRLRVWRWVTARGGKARGPR